MKLHQIVVALFAFCTPAFADPSLLCSSPAPWETGVDPKLKAVTLTFDQPMRQGFTSFAGSSSVLPEFPKPPSFDESGAVFTIPVNLLPGRVYVFPLNEEAHPGVGFQGRRGDSMAPVVLVFRTEGEPIDKPPSLEKVTFEHEDESFVIYAVFDQVMNTDGHGFVLRDASGPVEIEESAVAYDKKKITLRIPIPKWPLEIELNGSNNAGFRSSERIPLWPQRLQYDAGVLGPKAESEPEKADSESDGKDEPDE